MIQSYKYFKCVQEKLNEFVLAFFDRIEFETGEFSTDFFMEHFREIAARHRSVINEKCRQIYEEIKDWDQAEKSEICGQIRESNDIVNICAGNYQPRKFIGEQPKIYSLLKDFFEGLYNQVLDGKPFNEKFKTSLKNHYNEFSKVNSNITLCPICGISELKKDKDIIREQYDHYLPISKFPLSSVNFKNLVPTCRDCNSTDFKGDKDILAISKGRLFFPYQENYKGISIECNILNDDSSIENIEWGINFVNPDGYTEEIEAWKNIYCIDERYKGYIKGRIEKWYKHYWECMNDTEMEGVSEYVKNNSYRTYLKHDNSLGLAFIRKPALEGFLAGSVLPLAEIQAKNYTN
jgi:hypothetical protein